MDEKRAREQRIVAQQGGNLGYTLFFSIRARASGGDGSTWLSFPPERKCQHFTWAITGQRKSRARGEYISKQAPREHSQIPGLNYTSLSNPPYNSALSNVVTSQTSPHPIILIFYPRLWKKGEKLSLFSLLSCINGGRKLVMSVCHLLKRCIWLNLSHHCYS